MPYQLIERAKASIDKISTLNTHLKNKILIEMSQAILENSNSIIAENQKDILYAKENNLERIALKRLLIDEESIRNMAHTLRIIASLDDPIGKVLEHRNNRRLKIEKVSVPIGVVAVIYESRPNVTSDVAALCFKSGNISILKGGKEANHSNRAIIKVLHTVLEQHRLPKEAMSLLEYGTREDISKLIQEDKYIDLIIPRGGVELNQYIAKNSSVPVIQHDRGLCHVYIHKKADTSKALEIALNAKCEHPAVCNTMETLLIDSAISKELLPLLHQRFIQAQTKMKGCKETQSIIDVQYADEESFNTEYLDNIVNIRVVKNIDEAIGHIELYGSRHSEAIITEDLSVAEQFMNRIDASCIYLNASTKFTEGETFGMGSEVGISTSKLHARGPMGLKELTTYKYKIYGEGEIKVGWLQHFSKQEIIGIIFIGSLISFLPEASVMLPIGYFAQSQDVPLFLTLILGIFFLIGIKFKETKFKKLKYLCSKHPKFSNSIKKKIEGLKQFVSLPSALEKMPQKGQLLFKVLNSTIWVTLFTLLGYAIA